MTDDVKQRPVFRLVGASKSEEVVKEITGKQNATAIQGNAFEPEDEYQQLYVGGSKAAGLLEPPYKLRMLDRLSQENNALLPCIEAMVTNVDGTGYDFESDQKEAEDEEDDTQIEALKEFFDQPWPGVSFTTIRKELRRDVERTGNAYLEVLRNAQDEIVFLRHVDAKMMRLMKLDDAVPVEQTLRRKGAEAKVTVMLRERRFAQLVNGISLVYFKEFGAKRDLNKKTGTWAPQNMRLPAADRATEIIHFTALPDAHTPYGVPRWINQLPSVLGSRKAEEFNLEFFDNGGVPPMLIVLQGGTLQAETRNAVEQKMSRGSAASKNRVQVLEVEPTGGSLDSAGQARVTVERFGAERQNDSMFEGYDDKCETRIRRAFRLPPIFVGQAQDYSYATAVASYAVTEAQVFRPERDEFDEIISMKLITELGFLGYRMRSKPLVIEDAAVKLEGISLAIGTSQVDMADIISEINDAVGTNIKISEQPRPLQGATHTIDNEGNIVPVEQFTPPVPDAEGEKPGEKPKPGAAKQPPKKKPEPVAKASAGVLALAQDTLVSLRKRNFADLAKNIALFHTLDDHGQEEFRKACATMHFIDPAHDVDGLAELAGCTIAVMHAQHTN